MKKRKLVPHEDIRRFALVWEQMCRNFRTIPYDFFENSFFVGESLEKLGFEMDCGDSFEKVFPDIVLTSEDLDLWKNVLDKIDLETLGNALFSQWRWFNHWNEGGIKESDFEWFAMSFAKMAELAE